MKEELRALILYRLERADKTLDEAELLLEREFTNAYVNRLYYACFYAVSALLLTRGVSSSKHKGVRSFFHQYFVKTGISSKESGHIYDKFFDNRQRGDYEDFVRFDIEEIRDWHDEARQFVKLITMLVQEELNKN